MCSIRFSSCASIAENFGCLFDFAILSIRKHEDEVRTSVMRADVLLTAGVPVLTNLLPLTGHHRPGLETKAIGISREAMISPR